MSKQRESGYVAIQLIDDSGEFRLPLTEHEKVHGAWTRGEAFVETVQWCGAETTFKCSRIAHISKWTAGDLQRHHEQIREDRAEDKAAELTE